MTGYGNIEVTVMKNEFGIFWSGLTWHLCKKGNFELVLRHHVSNSLANSWCQEFQCK